MRKWRNDGNGNENGNGNGKKNGNENSLITRSSEVARSTSALKVVFVFEFCYCSLTAHKLWTAVAEKGALQMQSRQ